MSNQVEHEQIRRARGKFVAMASAYFLGVYNDNFFKQAALLLAVAAGRTEMQGYAIAIFTLPFLIFAAPAGWLADRYPKRNVVIAAKWIELAAMICGAIGICTGQWFLIFAMLATMGTQATIFSPALCGSIPELYPESYVTKANGVLRMIVTIGILSGIALAGIALDVHGIGPWGIDNGRFVVAVVIILVSLIGLAVSYGVFSRPAASPQACFPWKGPLDTIRTLWETRTDALLALIIGADVFIWFVGSLQILLINPLGLQQYKLSETLTSALIVSQLLGIGIGGLASGRLATGKKWFRVLIPAGFVMSVLMMGVAVVPSLPASVQLVFLFILIGLIGIFGGLFLIPCESFIQVRPAADRKGAIIASSNFVIFAGILLSGPLSNVFNAVWKPTTGYGIVGIVSFIVSIFLWLIFRKREWS